MTYRSIIDGQRGEPFIAEAMATRGPLSNVESLPLDVVESYQDILPNILLDVWENYGIGDLADGRLRLCVPAVLQPAINQLFQGDPYFGTETRAIAYGAFGDLVLWHPQHQLIFVNMQLSAVDAPALFDPRLVGFEDKVLLDDFLNMHPLSMDAYDANGQPMFEPAQEVHGPLKPLHIYGMHPPAPFHEAFTLDRHRPAEVVEWLSQKIGASVFKLDDVTGERLGVRKIGPLRAGETLRRPGEL